MKAAKRKLLKATSVNNNGRGETSLPPVKYLGFTLGVNTKLLVSDSTRRESRQMGTTVTTIKRFSSYERDAHLRTAVENQTHLIL